MRILGISFSARRNGNCDQSLLYLRDNVFAQDEFSTICVTDFSIKSCSNCQYECFTNKSNCPNHDEFQELFQIIIKNDLIIFTIPNYRGHSNSLYRVFNERFQSIEEPLILKYRKILKAIIVVGNITAGGSQAMLEIESDFSDELTNPETIILSSRYFNKKSINGDILESELAQHVLGNFALNTKKKYQSILMKNN